MKLFSHLALACLTMLTPSFGMVIYTGAANPSFITLGELFSGGSVTINNLTFDSWNLSTNTLISDHGALSTVEPSNIRVIGLDDDPLNEGLRFTSGTFGTKGSSVYYVEDFANLPTSHSVDTIIFEWQYEVTSLIGSDIEDNTLAINASGDFAVDNQFALDPKGVLQITENLSSGITQLGNKGVIVDRINDDMLLFDRRTFAPQTTLAVDSNITLTTGTNGDRVELFGFEQRFSQIPEPTSGLLFLVGGILALRRSRDL